MSLQGKVSRFPLCPRYPRPTAAGKAGAGPGGCPSEAAGPGPRGHQQGFPGGNFPSVDSCSGGKAAARWVGYSRWSQHPVLCRGVASQRCCSVPAQRAAGVLPQALPVLTRHRQRLDWRWNGQIAVGNEYVVLCSSTKDAEGLWKSCWGGDALLVLPGGARAARGWVWHRCKGRPSACCVRIPGEG